MKLTIRIALSAVAFSIGVGSLMAADVDTSKIPPASDKKGLTYATDIKPIFEKSCFKCHGTEKQKGKLRLDSLEAVMKGGGEGKIVEVGNGAKSMLVHSICHLGDEDHFMPPPDKGDKLSNAQIGIIRAWIDQGAK